MGLWVADESRGLFTPFGAAPRCPQPLSLCVCGNTVVCACMREARVFALDTGKELACYPLPPAVRRMCTLPGTLFALSSDGDSLSALCPRTGQLRLCTRAGCDPRDVQLSPDGRLLAAAGGAAGRVFLYESGGLRLLRAIDLPGVAEAACFLGGCLLALCAEGDGEVHSCLYHISARGVVREALRLPGLPGALLPLPDGTALCGTLGAVTHLRADGRVLRRWPCGLPARLRPGRGCALCADPLGGKALCVPLGPGRAQTLYSGSAPVDAVWGND